MSLQRFYRAQIGSTVVIALTMLLVAGGGGGDGGGGTPPPPEENIITVLSEDIFPDPGITVQVQVGLEATLDGSGSTTTSLGMSMEYVWSFSHRPDGSKAVLLDANTVAPRFTADVSGTYMVKLVVNVSGGSSSAVYASVEAMNQYSTPIPKPDNTTNITIKFYIAMYKS